MTVRVIIYLFFVTHALNVIKDNYYCTDTGNDLQRHKDQLYLKTNNNFVIGIHNTRCLII